jgi:Fe-S cluster assembly ATP-binding protein
MLRIENLNVSIDSKEILKNFNLSVNEGEVHVIMGPNGVGKSTLSRVIMGDNHYKITNGDILFNDESIKNMTTDVRSRKGIFLVMQYPMEIDGVSNQDFLRTAMSSHSGKKVGLYDFILQCEKASDELKIDKSLIHRSLNVGFSGGEKKKNEVLQMKLLKPSFVILDELDSGLDVDSVKIVAKNVFDYKKDNPNASILIITHLPKLLEYLKPDYVHVVIDGNIITSRGPATAMEFALMLVCELCGEQKYSELKSGLLA